MFRALLHSVGDLVSSDGAWGILALDGILLIPLVFAVFFYPAAVLIGLGVAGARRRPGSATAFALRAPASLAEALAEAEADPARLLRRRNRIDGLGLRTADEGFGDA